MDNQLKDILFNYEAKPRADLWEEITLSLDDTDSQLSEKLIEFEAIPPAHNWNQILSRLEEENTSKVISLPFYKRFGKPLKYGSAVAVLCIIAVISVLLFNNNSVTGVSDIPTAKTTEKTNIEIEENSQPLPNNTPAHNEPLAVNHSPATEQVKSRKRTTSAVEERNRLNSHLSMSAKSFAPINKETIVDQSLLDKYVVVKDESGNAIRVPKKIYDDFICEEVNNENTCLLTTLQQELAMQFDASDFTGLLNALQSLQGQ